MEGLVNSNSAYENRNVENSLPNEHPSFVAVFAKFGWSHGRKIGFSSALYLKFFKHYFALGKVWCR